MKTYQTPTLRVLAAETQDVLTLSLGITKLEYGADGNFGIEVTW